MPAFIFKLILCFLPGFAMALNISHNQTGQAIIIPYYTVNQFNTYITLTNTTDKIKAVKLSFREGGHGLEMLNVNAYIAPHETYVFGMVPYESTIDGHEGEDSVAIYQTGQVCTPFINTVEEFNAAQLDNQDVYQSPYMEYGTEGMIHIIEMGMLETETGYGPYIMDRDCQVIESLWAEGGNWDIDPTDYIQAPSGGLRATTSIIDVTNGFQFAVDNIVIDNFFAEDADILHTPPGEVNAPTLANAQNKYQGFTYESGIHALGAMLAKTSVHSDIVKANGVNATNAWVITLPLFPFMNLQEYKTSELTLYDQEGTIYQTDSVPGPIIVPPEYLFIGAINVIESMDSDDMLIPPVWLSTGFSFDFDNVMNQIGDGFNGISKLTIEDLPYEFRLVGTNASETRITHGAPVMGFSITRMQNNNAQPGLLATYATSQSLFYQSDSTTTPIED